MSILEAEEFFEDFFNVETSVSKNNDKNEKIAFLLAFFFLNLDERNRSTVLEKIKPEVDKFEKVFDYFLEIKGMDVDEYLKIRTSP